MTRQELEIRRLKAVPEIEAGAKQSELAKRYGVTRTTISRWKRALARGESLKATRAPGRPSRLTAAQVAEVRMLFYAGPKTPGARWTHRTFTAALRTKLKIKYSEDHVGRIMHQLGLTAIRHHEARV